MFSPFLKGSVLFIQNSPTVSHIPPLLYTVHSSIHNTCSINKYSPAPHCREERRKKLGWKERTKKEERREELGQKGEKKKEKKRLGVGTRQAYQKPGKVLAKSQAGETMPRSADPVWLYTDSLKHWDTGGERGSCGSQIPPKEGRERKKTKWKKAHFGWRLSAGTRHQSILCSPPLGMVPRRLKNFPSIANAGFMGVPSSGTRKERDFK